MLTEELKEKLIAVANEDYDGADYDEFKVVKIGDWIEDGKYSHQETVFAYGGKYYEISNSRCGSYFTDYEYGDPSVYEVEPVEVTTTIYRVVK